MSKKSAPSKPKAEPCVDPADEKRLLDSLRAHGQVKETDDPNAKLEPGQTHLLVKKKGQKSGRLIEKRKSFF